MDESRVATKAEVRPGRDWALDDRMQNCSHWVVFRFTHYKDGRPKNKELAINPILDKRMAEQYLEENRERLGPDAYVGRLFRL